MSDRKKSIEQREGERFADALEAMIKRRAEEWNAAHDADYHIVTFMALSKVFARAAIRFVLHERGGKTAPLGNVLAMVGKFADTIQKDTAEEYARAVKGTFVELDDSAFLQQLGEVLGIRLSEDGSECDCARCTTRRAREQAARS